MPYPGCFLRSCGLDRAADDLGGYGFGALRDGGFPLRGVAGGIVVEEAAAVLAHHQGLRGGALRTVVDEVIPALRAHHHLAGGALVLERLDNGVALPTGNSVVGGER